MRVGSGTPRRVAAASVGQALRGKHPGVSPMPHPKSTTILSVVLALPILTSGMASLNAQSAPGGLGTAGGAATSHSQIGVTSPPGVVLPNANGTGLGTSQPGYTRAFEGLNRSATPGSFRVPRRGASTLVPQRPPCTGRGTKAIERIRTNCF
jgi:hypothetical protein